MAARGAGIALIVVDASVLAPALLDDGAIGERARAALEDHSSIHAPQLLFAELLSRARRVHRSKLADASRCERALLRATQLPLVTHGHESLLPQVWHLRDRCSAYDALYVALSQIFDATLLTADARLARSVANICKVQVVDASA